MVRKQNERTILLQYRIIPLSLPTKTLFLILASRPLSTRLGAFSSPETFSHKFFPKFFPIRPRRLFSVFLVRKIMGTKGSWRSPNGGGVPFCMLPDAPESCSLSCSNRVRFSDKHGKKWQKLDFICLPWCFLGIFGDNDRQKPNIFLKCGCKVGAGCGSACLPFGVSTGDRVAGLLPDALPSCRVFRPFVRSLALSLVHCT